MHLHFTMVHPARHKAAIIRTTPDNGAFCCERNIDTLAVLLYAAATYASLCNAIKHRWSTWRDSSLSMTSLALDDASRVLAARTAAYDACVARREHVGPTNYDFSFLSIDNALKTRRT